jgi:hypothetical protein
MQANVKWATGCLNQISIEDFQNIGLHFGNARYDLVGLTESRKLACCTED